ncbi:hypothetical protein HDU90_002916 [Geranomyces variabilis]|nr:hypothetical protein HDU90_002916 [Geranomyces variabilis]
MNVRIKENVEPDDFLLEMNATTPEYDLGLGKRARSPTPTPALRRSTLQVSSEPRKPLRPMAHLAS